VQRPDALLADVAVELSEQNVLELAHVTQPSTHNSAAVM
jgi:hypothetical protein